MTNTINIMNNSNIENINIKKVIELLGRKLSVAKLSVVWNNLWLLKITCLMPKRKTVCQEIKWIIYQLTLRQELFEEHIIEISE